MGRSKFDSDWECTACGTLQSKHSQYFDGECETCCSLKLFESEQKALGDILPSISHQLKSEFGLLRISGAFCNLDYQECDEDTITLKLRIGTCDEGGYRTQNGWVYLNRNTLEVCKLIWINKRVRELLFKSNERLALFEET